MLSRSISAARPTGARRAYALWLARGAGPSSGESEVQLQFVACATRSGRRRHDPPWFPSNTQNMRIRLGLNVITRPIAFGLDLDPVFAKEVVESAVGEIST